MNKRALISVTNKEGIIEFAKSLNNFGYEIVSTGNTYKTLKENNIDVIQIDEVTNFPEMLDGRVKTLNPYIHGGILYKRDKTDHVETIRKHKIRAIDMVVVNLYDFEGSLKSGKDHSQMVENIDIGGPTLIRAAAKNYKDVTVVVDVKDYDFIIERLENEGLNLEDRKKLAFKAFSLTGRYDALISSYFANVLNEKYPEYLNLTFERECDLRYGENPHQEAVLYKQSNAQNSILNFEQLNGKELSFNNINDLNSLLEIIKEFKDSKEIACVAIKHTNPCGVGIGVDSYRAYEKCYEADKTSIFGGIVGITSIIDEKTAKKMNDIFLEIIVANDFTEGALEILKQKKNLRLLKISNLEGSNQNYDFKYLDGKLLAQDKNKSLSQSYKVVTVNVPNSNEIKDMEFALKIVKHMKSNAIAIVKDGQTLALGCGQTSRIWALKNAIENNDDKSFEGAILASDAFFPFEDCVTLAAKYGIKGIIQPGGSMRDEDSIKACDENNISMVFTGIRHFKH